LHLGIVCEPRAQFAKDLCDVCVGWLSEAVVSPLAVAARGDEAGAAEVREVSRNFWLIGPQNFNARTDAQLIVTEQVNETETRWVSKRFED